MWQCVLKAWLIHACCALHESRCVCMCSCVCRCVCSRVAEHVFNCINITFFYITIKSCLVLCAFALVRQRWRRHRRGVVNGLQSCLSQNTIHTLYIHAFERRYVCMYIYNVYKWYVLIVRGVANGSGVVMVMEMVVGSVLANKACSNNNNNNNSNGSNKRPYNGTLAAVSAYSTHVKRSTTTINSSACLPFLRALCSCSCCCSQCSSCLCWPLSSL